MRAFQNTNKIKRIAVFQDTMRRFQNDEALKKCTLQMQQDQRLYLDQYQSVRRVEKTEDISVFVSEESTFECAKRILDEGGGRIAVLNFANAYYPGGGVQQGSGAQEECLCRCSNLYQGLTLPYFIRHYYKWNQKNTGDAGTDRLIYSPGVTVIKGDDYHLLAAGEIFRTDVITCAAPYYDKEKKHPLTEGRLQEIFYQRWMNILEAAMGNNVDALILGAFGCGAFHNPPEIVAGQLAKLIYEKEYGRYFRKIILAVKSRGSDDHNLEVFRKVFS